MFFILQSLGIKVDLALVNYHTRKESNLEEKYAKELAKKFDLKLFLASAPKFESNFESRAREFRYNFFEEVIEKENYQTLLTAHHLGDRLEWFFMRLIRGAGAVELSGMEFVSKRFTKSKKTYLLIRPLLNISKDELLDFLDSNQIKYFIDSSNYNQDIERNYIRANFSEPLLKRYKNGIKRSFEYLERDKLYLNKCFRVKKIIKDLAIFQLKDPFCSDRAASSFLKQKGILISTKERENLVKNGFSLIGRKWVAQREKGLLFISPFYKASIPKNMKEKFRIAKIPPKIRPYIYLEKIKLF